MREVEFLFILVFILSWIFRHSVCQASFFFGFFPTSEQLIVELSGEQRGTEKFYRFSFFPLHFAALCLRESKGKHFCRFRIGKHFALPLCQNLCETRAHSGKLIFENLSKSVDKFSVCISMDALSLYDSSIALDISLKILSSPPRWRRKKRQSLLNFLSRPHAHIWHSISLPLLVRKAEEGKKAQGKSESVRMEIEWDVKATNLRLTATGKWDGDHTRSERIEIGEQVDLPLRMITGTERNSTFLASFNYARPPTTTTTHMDDDPMNFDIHASTTSPSFPTWLCLYLEDAFHMSYILVIFARVQLKSFPPIYSQFSFFSFMEY